jgi:hypothetical protein
MSEEGEDSWQWQWMTWQKTAAMTEKHGKC